MSDTLVHRGPDDSGYYTSGPVAFGFRRLAILDLTIAGHQPMLSEDGRVALVYNGEIYNYADLRAELEAHGHRFRSQGDTEVLLHAYLQWGTRCLERFNGMWAFLIHDTRTGVIFGARDRFGVKPLYRYTTPSEILFASEIKAIRASGRYREEGTVDWTRAARFLSVGRLDMLDETSATSYPGIEQVPAGSAFEVYPDGRRKEWRYWSLDAAASALDGRGSPADPPAAFYSLFEDSVRLRTRSDVPVGVTLSGGLDSTSIIAIMADLDARNRTLAATSGDVRESNPASCIHAFSFVTPEFDERRYIADTVAQTGACLTVAHIDPMQLWDSLEMVLWYHDEPVHSLSVLIGFELYRLARANGVKVVMCGQGADEYLAGYPAFFGDYWQTLIRAGRLDQARGEMLALAQGDTRRANEEFRAAMMRFVRSQAGRLPGYSLLREARRRAETAAISWYDRDFLASAPPPPPPPTEQGLRTALHGAMTSSPLPLYLRVEDRNSMAHSVEARLPFLDYRLVVLVSQMADSWKLRGGITKHVMREALRGRIPESVRTRSDKMGFPAPTKNWFAGPLYESMQDLLSSASVRTRGIYNVPAIRRDLERHRVGQVDLTNSLFNVAQLESWLPIAQGSAKLASMQRGAPAAPQRMARSSV